MRTGEGLQADPVAFLRLTCGQGKRDTREQHQRCRSRTTADCEPHEGRQANHQMVIRPTVTERLEGSDQQPRLRCKSLLVVTRT